MLVEKTAALGVSSMDMTVTYQILLWGWYNQYGVLTSFQEIMYFVSMYIWCTQLLGEEGGMLFDHQKWHG